MSLKGSAANLNVHLHYWMLDTCPTAWMFKHKIVEVMRLSEASREFTGRVETVDAGLGGEHHGGKTGRGSPDKISFVAGVQNTESGEPVLVC